MIDENVLYNDKEKEIIEQDTIKEKINKKITIRRKMYLVSFLICLGLLIFVWANVWFFSLNMGWGLFVSIFLIIFSFIIGGSYEV
jgi:uncharacterized membrane protein